MFTVIFNSLIKYVLVPILAIWGLTSIYDNHTLVWSAVIIIYSLMMIPTLLWELIKIIPNLAFIRMAKVMKNVMEFMIGLIALLAFWYYYIVVYIQ